MIGFDFKAAYEARRERAGAMTLEAAVEMLKLLSATFDVTVPFLHWSGRVKNGRYSWGTVRTGPRCWRGTEATIVHEFTHHLVAMRRRGPDAGWYRRDRRTHGADFLALLKAVAAAWYGDPSRYDWKTEYKSMRRIGIELADAAGPREE